MKDNGIGIDLEKYSGQIFVPFKRIEAKDTEGTGLGLYIIKNMLEKNGGSLKKSEEVSSKLGKIPPPAVSGTMMSEQLVDLSLAHG